MSIKSVTYKSAEILNGKAPAIVTKWSSSTNYFATKTYHIVVLKGSLFGFSNNSAYVTNKIPKKQDLSESTLHTSEDNSEVLKDQTGNVICSYKNSDKVGLGFMIDDKEFEKVDSISEDTITKLANFLKNYLQKEQASKSRDGKLEVDAPASKDKANAVNPIEKPEGFIRSSISALSSRVTSLSSKAASFATCDRLGFLATSTAVVLYWMYLNADIDPTIGTTL